MSIYHKEYNCKPDINIFNVIRNTLKEEETLTCEGLLTEDECFKALKEMKNDKSPGSDGITVEFYKTFWDDLNQYLVDSLNFSFVNGHLTDLQKQGILSLIPKSGFFLTTLSNWRSVTLLTVDYKTATKPIANRVNNVISQIINKSQTGFIKG